MGTPSANRRRELPDPFCIGDWTVHASVNQLSTHDKTVKLEPRTMEVLLYLVERAGQAVARERLEDDIWKDRVVGYDSLNITISKLRRALQDDAKNPRYIQTLSKVGYRFIGQVEEGAGELHGAGVVSSKIAPGRRFPLIMTAAACVLGLIAVATMGVWSTDAANGGRRAEDSSSSRPAGKPSIAVLPFHNMSGDPQQGYFSEGITDDLITDLSKISGLVVMSRHSVFAYKNKSNDVREIARQLNVRYVLKGSVRKAKDGVRINAQLIDAPAGTQLWADRYDGPLADVFTLQDDVVGRIVAALKVRLTPEEKKSAETRETEDIGAYDAFLRGLALVSRETPEDAAAALPFFKAALTRDADYGRAYAALAQTHWDYAINRHFNLLVMPATGAWAPGGYSNYLAAWRFLRDAGINPTSEGYALSSRMLQRQRRFEEAMNDAQLAVELSPYAPNARNALIEALIYSGDERGALRRIEESIDLDPVLPGEQLFLAGLAYYSLGQLDEAIRSISRARIHNPRKTRYAAILAVSLAESGRREESNAALQDYLSGWESIPDLDAIMLQWPFRRASATQRFAESMIYAGMPAQTANYFSVGPADRLSGEEIRTLLPNRTMIGIDRSHPGGVKFQVKWGDGMQVLRQDFVTFFRVTGEIHVTNDLLCATWYDWGNYCVAVFRNTKGARERSDEYVFYTLTSTFTFSVVETTPDSQLSISTQ